MLFRSKVTLFTAMRDYSISNVTQLVNLIMLNECVASKVKVNNVMLHKAIINQLQYD
jgi:hypothetical protein